ncbi:MAG: AbgT family transporter [Clostridia bacterium]|nr:AbgT family transporter [Clostridia bacterium]
MNGKKDQSQISAKSFITAIIVIAVLMILTYVLVLALPSASLPVWKWILSPFLVLGAEGSATIIAVIIFLLVIGGIFNALEKGGLMKYMLDKIAGKYKEKRYKLMTVVMFFFMALGALIGSFEECVPLVPIVVALSIKLGWDALTGMGMSLLAIGCGFASGVFNPFTIGVAQELAGLPMFSGAWLRAVSFVLIYALLWLFVRKHAKKVDRGVQGDVDNFVADKKMDKALFLFALILGIGIVIILFSPFIKVLQDYTMIIVAVMFLVAGIVSNITSGMSWKDFGKNMGTGVVNMLPAVLMILMASSIKYTLETAGALTVILDAAIGVAGALPKWSVILFIYLIVLVMNFFVASGSAKAFMLIPLIVPLAAIFEISPQLCILAFAFGDGFSNVFYPTNPALLISLGPADVNYGDWVKWSWKFQLSNLILTSLILLFGLAIGF